MKIRIRKRDGFWKTYFVVDSLGRNYDVLMDKYSTWEEAIAVAFFVIGTHIDINVKECTQCDGAGIVSHMIYNGQETTYICDMCNGSGVE